MFLLAGAGVYAQAAATLQGTVRDPGGGEITGAVVAIQNSVTGFNAETSTTADGTFSLGNIPFGNYVFSVRKHGFEDSRQTVSLKSNIPVVLPIVLALEAVKQEVSVSAFDKVQLVDAEATGTRAHLSVAQIEKMPLPVGTRGLESVLLSFPGFAANANGAIHPRGAHNQMTYVIDGMPISDQLTGAFGNGVDYGIVESIELLTGNIPPEYGSKVSGVANITTRSGLNSGRRFFGRTEVGAAQFDQLSHLTQLGGQAGRFGYFASFTAQKSNRFLDPVSIDNLHNGGNAERGFVRFDYQIGAADFFRVNALGGRSSFELANLRSQHARGQDQRQVLRDIAISIGYIHVIGPSATFEATDSYRTSVAQLFASPGDTPVTAAQSRHLSNFSAANRMNLIRGRHEFRVGFDYQHFP